MKKGKKNVSIQAKRRLFFLRPICFVAIFLLIATFISYSITLYHLTEEKKEKETNYIKLQEESEFLKNEITKLNNPEYIARFARENYFYSKDGELIIKIDDKKEEILEAETDIKDTKISYNKYLIIGVIILVIYSLITFIKRKEDN